MQKVNILGLELNDHTKRESIDIARTFIDNGILDVIQYVDHDVLTKAGNDDELRKWIESVGLIQWGSLDILETAGISGNGRQREVENREFFRELLHIIEHDHRPVFLLSDESEQIEYLRKTIRQMQPGIMIAGSVQAEMDAEKIKSDINEINSVSPTIVIARMDVMKQFKWLRESNGMVNASIWIGMPSDMPLIIKNNWFIGGIKKSFKKMFFSRKVNRYSSRKSV
jgi:UDP-N-acetyl-D-mannosaminuronic acid transferase (WecB/TagA/CpsF family)